MGILDRIRDRMRQDPGYHTADQVGSLEIAGELTARKLPGHGNPKPQEEIIMDEEKIQTKADLINYWCKQYDATYEISQPGMGARRRISLKFPNGDVVSGNGQNMDVAVADLAGKLEKAK